MADADVGIHPPDEPDPELGVVIQRVRTGRGLTRAQLARQVGVDESELVACEAGAGDLDRATLKSIALALQTSLSALARAAEESSLGEDVSGDGRRHSDWSSIGKRLSVIPGNQVISSMNVDRVAQALGHPRRVRILVALLERPASATALSRDLAGISRGDAHYHLTKLLEVGAIALRSSRAVRGATELTYALSSDDVWKRAVEALVPFVANAS